MRPPRLEKIQVPGPAGPLEALLETPQEGARAAVALICHPHPQHGGTMRNKVAHTLARATLQLGIASLRFNFRGVGESAGSYGEGEGELQDCLAAADWLATAGPGQPLWLAGFSFGACVAMRAALRRPVAQLITIAPAIERCALESPPQCPWFIVQGDEDELVDAQSVVDWVDAMPPGPQLSVLRGVDHFFHGRLIDLRDLLVVTLGDAAAGLATRHH